MLGASNVWCTGGGWCRRADDGLEVVDAERVGVQPAVPADDVEGMVGVRVAGQLVALAHEDVDPLAVGHAAARSGPAGRARSTGRTR